MSHFGSRLSPVIRATKVGGLTRRPLSIAWNNMLSGMFSILSAILYAVMVAALVLENNEAVA